MEEEEKKPIPEAKLRKLRNLKYFRDWDDEQIQEWYRLRHGDDEAPPETPPELNRATYTPSEAPSVPEGSFNAEEYKKKFNQYLNRYKKEYAVDMNEANDAEALRSLVRFIIQLERADELVMEEQARPTPDHRVLKGYGDFQRSIQMSVNELQDKLGISRKQRKDKQVDDIPQYIREIRQKAKDFWNGKTLPVRCEKCKIELARYWINFPDKTKKINFELICDKCDTGVSYTA